MKPLPLLVERVSAHCCLLTQTIPSVTLLSLSAPESSVRRGYPPLEQAGYTLSYPSRLKLNPSS